LSEVKVFRRSSSPQLVATIPVGDLPHGFCPSGDGSRIYVALENSLQAAVIDTQANKVIADVRADRTDFWSTLTPGLFSRQKIVAFAKRISNVAAKAHCMGT
jgi:YVTN family beta-propeller protein